MHKQPLISILICTRDRASDLRQTLEAIANLRFSVELPCELVVVDNASRDETAQVVEEAGKKAGNLEIRCIHEASPGLSYARNTAIKAARGEVILFTDDDVRPDANWLAGMSTPLLNGEADAVTGGVRLAPHLERKWMTDTHRGYFACSAHCSGVPGALVGANMSVHRRVFEKIPAFDVELGAGRMGFAEDTLFSFQLLEAGYRLHGAWDVQIEHHFDPSRLGREPLRKRALQQGHSNAYIWHHWLHAKQLGTRARLGLRCAQQAILQLKHREQGDEGCSLAEAEILENIGFYQQYLIEVRRPRNYAKRGLIKLNSEVAAASKQGKE